ncbi:sodium ABC transporter permease [Clostridium sp. CAG:433]|nr:sodium ABC transporter permease [Clostridium sp. CAG:433]
MTNKFWFLTKNSLQKKMKNKTFIIVNILLLIVLVALINIDRVVMLFGGNFDKQNNIMVLDNTNKTYEIFKKTIDSEETIIDTGLKYKVKKVSDEKKAKKEIKKDEDILLIINNDENDIINVTMITYGYINSNLYQLINSSITASKQNLAMEEIGISAEELAKISKSVEIKREYIEANKSKEEEQNEFIMGIVTPIVIFPFFMLITLVVQMVGAEINEEKSTRSMEIIISNVPAKVHFFSKILAANLFVIIQCALLGLYSLIGILLRGGKSLDSIQNVDVISNVTSGMDITGMINNLVGYIPLVLILMAVTLLGYSLLAGILASMTTNMEDFQQLQTPIFVVSLVGFYLAIMNTMFDGAIFIRVLSYVPFISAILSPSLLVTGVIGFKDIILSILLMVVVIYLLLKYGLKIYKEGILNYSSNKLWKKMLKALKH